MSGKRRKKIHDVIRELGKADKYEVFNGKVKAVSEEDATCDVDIDDDLTVFAVRLRSVVTDNKGVWALPKVDSDVQIAQIEGGTDFIVIKTSEVDKVFIVIGDTSIEVTDTQIKVNEDVIVIEEDEITINGGSNDGVPKVAAVKTKLNNLENKMNALITAMTTLLATPVAEPGNGAPSAFQVAMNTALTTWKSTQLTATTQADLENAKFKH